MPDLPEDPRLAITLKLRIHHEETYAFGPGKAALLEAIEAGHSISAAGRLLGLSYSKTRRLVDELNHSFREPLVTSTKGGAGGGEAHVTGTGLKVLAAFRAMEARARQAVLEDLEGILAELRPADS